MKIDFEIKPELPKLKRSQLNEKITLNFTLYSKNKREGEIPK